ncbi:hypothetical protein DFH09DRAFT_1087708 [Mycena vulgaris]|nr:hypothetical protein DFH09DRAFT_1087708 [Mycena vulgaris]
MHPVLIYFSPPKVDPIHPRQLLNSVWMENVSRRIDEQDEKHPESECQALEAPALAGRQDGHSTSTEGSGLSKTEKAWLQQQITHGNNQALSSLDHQPPPSCTNEVCASGSLQVFLLLPQHPSQSPVLGMGLLTFAQRHLLPSTLIDKVPSASDKPGAFYGFVIEDDTLLTLKMGHAKSPWKRQKQWVHQCKGQCQRWLVYWHVPICGEIQQCRGQVEFVEVVESYLHRLGWQILIGLHNCDKAKFIVFWELWTQLLRTRAKLHINQILRPDLKYASYLVFDLKNSGQR